MAILRTSGFWLVVTFSLLVVWVYRAHVQAFNGFDISNTLIPAEAIHQGGPEKDGIPALLEPEFESVTAAMNWLRADDLVLGLSWRGEQRAYPVPILNWHEVVNDRIGGQPVLITFCPLCGSGMAFSPVVEGQSLTFGVSGLLYNSDLLLYDHQTQSLWSQILGQAVSGPLKGKKLQQIPVVLQPWSDWRRDHPQRQVLSRKTGFARDYRYSPYRAYSTDKGVFFPVAFSSQRYHPKERVLGVEIEGSFKAYPFAELARSELDVVWDEFAGQRLEIRFDAKKRIGRVFNSAGEELPVVNLFWFAWYAFYPQSDVFRLR